MALNEVLDEDTGEIAGAEIEGEWQLRLALIRLEQLDRDTEAAKRRKAMIADTYDREIANLGQQAAELRRSVEGFIHAGGGEKVRFPDVGTAYLRKSEPKIEIVDRDAFEAALGSVYQKTSFDETSAKAYALDLALETGEIEPVPGARLIPAGKTLGIRKA